VAAPALVSNESEMIPTLAPEPSMPKAPRAWSASSCVSPSERTDPHGQVSALGVAFADPPVGPSAAVSGRSAGRTERTALSAAIRSRIRGSHRDRDHRVARADREDLGSRAPKRLDRSRRRGRHSRGDNNPAAEPNQASGPARRKAQAVGLDGGRCRPDGWRCEPLKARDELLCEAPATAPGLKQCRLRTDRSEQEHDERRDHALQGATRRTVANPA